jgi:hypothetical protein
MSAVFSYLMPNYDASEANLSYNVCIEYTTSQSYQVHYSKPYSQSTVQISKWKGKPRQGKTIIVKGLHLSVRV